MRILYLALRYDYGRRERGFGYEHWNFYHTLAHMGCEILYFPMERFRGSGREAAHRNLQDVVRSEKPDLLFTVLVEEELDRDVLRRLTASGTTTLNWFCDDQWRWEDYSRHWAPLFTAVVTTSREALDRYRALGTVRAVKSQYACNPFVHRPRPLPLVHDVTFVGQPHGTRRAAIDRLIRSGIPVKTWGNGWESGRLSQEEMIDVFAQSRINLSLSDTSSRGAAPRPNPIAQWIRRTPLLGPLARGLKRLVRPARPPDPSSSSLPTQIKGRDFEVPACGGLLMTGGAEDFDSYLIPGREAVRFESIDDLAEKIRHYLSHEEERRSIAEAGCRRVHAEHTYVHRFSRIFRELGLAALDPDRILRRPPEPGRTTEVA
jgi:spore maturation protein CgeB